MKEIAQADLGKAYSKALSAYSHRENVTGIDIGYKYLGLDDQPTKQLSIRIHVNEKIQESALEDAERFPEEIEGVPVDVIEANYTTHEVTSRHPARSFPALVVQPGISVAHFGRTAGTIGLIVYDNLTGSPCLLSNWHVLAGSLAVNTGDPILQPGPNDGGERLRHTIATLGRRFINQNGDAAIAILTGSRSFLPNQLESGVVITQTRMPQLGEVLEKSGRGTGITQAVVEGIGRYFIEDYRDIGRIGIDGFKLVSIQDGNPDDIEVSAKGDSGSCWYNPASAEGVGLHFAGETDVNPRAEYALACFLPRILEALNISLAPPDIIQPNELETIAFTPTSNQVVDAGIPANLTIYIHVSVNGTEVFKTRAM